MRAVPWIHIDPQNTRTSRWLIDIWKIIVDTTWQIYRALVDAIATVMYATIDTLRGEQQQQ